MIPYQEVVRRLSEEYRLTKKESSVLKEIILSGPNKEVVGLKLNIAPSTAYLHFKRIYEKLKVDGMAQLFHLVIKTHENLSEQSVGEKNQQELG